MSTRARRAPAGDGLFILGLIGRAGSGKTTVARALERDGAWVIEADALGHEVTDHDPEVRAALTAEYGAEVYGAEGRLDRPRVAARVFHDPAARARLDRLVHPRIIARIGEALDRLRAAGRQGVVVIEAALLPRWGLERGCDAVLAVTAPEPMRIERLMRRRNWSESEARARLAVQDDDRVHEAVADVTIDNRGDPETLESRARDAVARLRAEHAAAPGA
jgi:dephospho-CoA kinase